MRNIDVQLKKKIMRRVYGTFFVRKVSSPFAVKLYILVSFTGFLISQISLGNVVANMPQVTNLGALYRFSTSAFLNTEMIVQLLSLGALIATVLLFKDVVKIYFTPTSVTA
jgi:hypothetical protein